MAQEPEATLKFNVEGKQYEVVPLDDFELGEIEEVEEALDRNWDDIEWSRAKALRWLLFVTIRRKNPDVKFEELGHMKIAELLPDDDDEPTSKAQNGPTPAKRKRPTKAG